MMLAVSFLYMAFIMLRHIPSIFSLNSCICQTIAWTISKLEVITIYFNKKVLHSTTSDLNQIVLLKRRKGMHNFVASGLY